MQVPDLTYKEAKEISAPLKTALQKPDALGAAADPDILIAITRKPAAAGQAFGSAEVVLLHKDGTRVERTQLGHKATAGQQVAPADAKQFVALTTPDVQLRICIPVQGGYVYF